MAYTPFNFFSTAHHGDDVYDLLSASFDDPSATIVYPYVYRILNSSNARAGETAKESGTPTIPSRPLSRVSARPMSPATTVSPPASVAHVPSSPSRRTSPSNASSHPGNANEMYSPMTEEPDPDAQLLVIIGHISSETTGALHKEGITELHHFLKAHPHKKPRVDKMLDSTGAAFRKYIHRALASRAAEDQERDIAVADTLSSAFFILYSLFIFCFRYFNLMCNHRIGREWVITFFACTSSQIAGSGVERQYRNR